MRNINNLLVSWCLKPKYAQVGDWSNIFIKKNSIHSGIPFALNPNPHLTLNNQLFAKVCLSLWCAFCCSKLQPFHFQQWFFAHRLCLFNGQHLQLLECKYVIQLLIIQIQKSKGTNQIWSNLEEGYEEPSMLPQIFKCLCSLNIVGKWGTPFLWCKYLWCVHKCYFQICFLLSIFSLCPCSTIFCFLHFNHLGSQRPMFTFVFQSYESTWCHFFYSKYFCKFVDCLRFVSKATL